MNPGDEANIGWIVYEAATGQELRRTQVYTNFNLTRTE